MMVHISSAQAMVCFLLVTADGLYSCARGPVSTLMGSKLRYDSYHIDVKDNLRYCIHYQISVNCMLGGCA